VSDLALSQATLDRWYWHPDEFVREEFQVEPDDWQLEGLRVFPRVNRLCFKAAKGPGKSALLAWLIWNFMVTRSHTRIGCVSITGDNLKSNLWSELAYWQNLSPFCRSTFQWSQTQIVHKSHPATWWAQARSWPKQADVERQSDALAGLHAKNAMAVLDESGGIPQGVMVTAEAVLATGGDTKVLQAGNPTHTTGPLHRACTVDRALWHVITITGDPDDPKRSTRIDRKWAQDQIDSYGRDNPWVMVNVLGMFPPSSINALLGINDVEAAMTRKLRPEQYQWAQKRLGIDVARFGDDRTVLFPRQGLASFRPVVMRNADTVEIATRAFQAIVRWDAELVLVDDTGHWGHGVIDNLTKMPGVNAIGINYAGKATDPRFKNVRCEFWMKGAEAIKAGAVLPKIPAMVPEFTEPTYTFVGGQFLLEPKDLIKKRLGRSPDYADAYMQTYAIEDVPAQMMQRLGRANTVRHDQDPFAGPARIEDHGRVSHDGDPW